MEPFTYDVRATRVVFAPGSVGQIGDEIRRLDCSRALVLTTPEQKNLGERVLASLVEVGCGIFAKAQMHTPTGVTQEAVEFAHSVNADCLVAIGGGSTIGLGKAISLRTGLKQIAVSTTYAGSEMTPILGETENGVKKTIRSPKVLPQTVLYDVGLTMTLPALMSVVSGMNAIAHAVEALYAKDSNPIVSLMAEEGIRALAHSLPRLVSDPLEMVARSDAQYGAWLCGTCLGAVGMALHHKVCHVLGGTFDLPHAETHTVILPHALAYNAASCPQALVRIERALGQSDAPSALYALGKGLGAPMALRDLGMPESGLATATALILKDSYWNPRPLEEDAIFNMLSRAWHGQPPTRV